MPRRVWWGRRPRLRRTSRSGIRAVNDVVCSRPAWTPAAGLESCPTYRPNSGKRCGIAVINLPRKEHGFTLLEVLVATVILAIAVTGLMSALSGSMRNAARLTDYDRAAMLARRKMDELLEDKKLPKFVFLEGRWDPVMTGGRESGWRARIQPWEMLPNPAAGMSALDRIELEVWWLDGSNRRTFQVEGFRRSTLTETDVRGGAVQ